MRNGVCEKAYIVVCNCYQNKICNFRQLNMFMMMMQMNPELLSVLGGGHRQITREIERIEKYKELKVCNADLSYLSKIHLL